jgi:uncharacterized surface protein with fasciclin (FAS1) repeats
MSSKISTVSILGLFVVFALAVTQCAMPTAPVQPAAPEEAAPTAEAAEELPSIAEIVVESANDDPAEFTTLLAAVDAAGLVDTLSGPGTFTVFAPTDEAFAALPEGTLDAVLADPEGALTDILLYHVAGEALMASDVVELDSAPTLQGGEISIEVMDGKVMLNESVTVVATDIEASNGVVHVIDAVLLPPSDEAMSGEMMEELPSIAEIVVESASGDPAEFTTLLAAVDAAGLVETLSGPGTFTVFAPTDEAFAALPEGTLDAVLADPEGALTDILLYHVAGEALMASDVVELDSAPTLQGSEISIEVMDGKVMLNDSVMVVATDIEASNGVVHVIDAVLLPPSDEAMGSDMAEELPSIAEIVVESASGDPAEFTTLLAAVDAAGLVETLSGPGTFTVFAPTDEAFAALPEGTLDTLLADPEGALTDILLYHVAGEALLASDVVELDSAPTLQGGQISIEVMDGKVMLNGTTMVIATDILASNGVIHVIDAVLIPGEEEAMKTGMKQAPRVVNAAAYGQSQRGLKQCNATY